MANITITTATDVGQGWVLTDSAGGLVAQSDRAVASCVVRNVPDDTYTINWTTIDGYAVPSPRRETAVVTGTGAFASPTYSASANNVTSFWVNDGTDKVTQDELRETAAPQTNHAWDGTTVTITGARNEVVSFSLYLEVEVARAKNVAVTMSNLDLGGTPGANSILAGARASTALFDWTTTPTQIELFYVRYLEWRGLSFVSYGKVYEERQIPEKAQRPWTLSGNPPRGVPDAGTDWYDRPNANKYYPDVAVPMELVPTFDVAAGESQQVWCDVYIPKTSTPGTYTGEVSIVEDGGAARLIPVELVILPMTALPDIPSQGAMVNIADYEVNWRHYGGRTRLGSGDPDAAASVTTMDNYVKLLHRHRLSVIGNELGYFNVGEYEYDVIPTWWTARLNGSLFTGTYDGPGVNTGNGIYSIGTYAVWRYRWSTDQATGKPTAADLQVVCDPWVTWFEANFPNVPYFVYLGDEVPAGVAAPSSDILYRGDLEEWAQEIKANPAPGNRMKTFTTISYDKALEATAGEGTPTVDYLAHPTLFLDENICRTTFATLELDAGRFTCVYNGQRPLSGSFAIEDEGSALVELGWAQAKLGYDWHFYWTANSWFNVQSQKHSNPLSDSHTFGGHKGFDPIEGETGKVYDSGGTLIEQTKYSTGDALLVYPGTDYYFPANSYDIDGPIASLRLKHWRRGIQDAEYIAMARAENLSAANAVVDGIVGPNHGVLWEIDTFAPQDFGYQYVGIDWPTDPDTWATARAALVAIIP